MKKIAIITARSGSKGLPNKNVLLADGKPLIAYSIEAAIESKQFEHILVSTDSQEYIDLLSHYPIEFIKRAEHLATDTTSSFEVIEDVLNQYKGIDFDYFVLLQPTSPLRNAQHIIESCEKFERNIEQFDFLVSVSDAHKPTTLTRVIDVDESLKNFQLDYSNYARQQYLKEYSPNGAIFTAKPQAYLKQKHFYGEKCLAYFMDKTVSVDIDDRNDFEYFYHILQQRKREEILLNQIKLRIAAKKMQFNEVKPITFIGHSILDFWHIEKIGQSAVNNLAVAGISSGQYLELIIQSKLLSQLGEKIVIMLGTNDIVKPNWTHKSVLENIQTLINELKIINENSDIYFLEITPVALRADRKNTEIRELNHFLKQSLTQITWIDLDNAFSDKYAKLDLKFSDDGLHLNQKGYQLLEKILSEHITLNENS